MRPDTEVKVSLKLIRPCGRPQLFITSAEHSASALARHNRSSVASTASAEHGASTSAWEGTPYCGEPRGVYTSLPGRVAGTVGLDEVYLGTLEKEWDHEALPQGALRLVLNESA